MKKGGFRLVMRVPNKVLDGNGEDGLVSLIQPSKKLYKADLVLSLFFTATSRHREVKKFAQGKSARRSFRAGT